ncbi:helix-turn-helix transcriptional regulator [Cellulosimicrobium funkei]
MAANDTNHPHISSDRPLSSVAELAAHLGVSRRTVFRWHAEGRGPRALRSGAR